MAPHKSVDESAQIVTNVFAGPEIYALCPIGTDRPVGCVGLSIGPASHFSLPETEAELGYWIGVPFWGQGLVPEACRVLLRRAFKDLRLDAIWLGYYDGNDRSRRVAEKLGFARCATHENAFCELIGETRTECVARLTSAEYWATTGKT